MWPSWQPQPSLTLTPNLELPSHEQRREICQHEPHRACSAHIKTNTKLSCQNFRFNDLPVAGQWPLQQGMQRWETEESGQPRHQLSPGPRTPSSLAKRCIQTSLVVWQEKTWISWRQRQKQRMQGKPSQKMLFFYIRRGGVTTGLRYTFKKHVVQMCQM